MLDDADLRGETIERIARSVFAGAGQVCMAIKRIYVSESRFAEFSAAFNDAVDRYVVGDGLAAGVTMGPMHTKRRDATGHWHSIEDAAVRGAKVSQLGKIDNETTFRRGYFVRPTVVTELADDAPLMVEEQFCPVVPITIYNAVDDAIERANNTHFGLCASVWSSRPDRALGIARQLQAGTVFVNTHGVASVNRNAPYGGIKQSGMGRRCGIEGIMEYLQIQSITTAGDLMQK